MRQNSRRCKLLGYEALEGFEVRELDAGGLGACPVACPIGLSAE